MTTSFWPRQPHQGDNAIGQFVIGVSPIGTIPALDWHGTVISQYANSPRLLTLIDNLFTNIDPTKITDDWFSDVWLIDTAVGYGLDVWGRIVGISRVLKLPSTDFFGFFNTDNQPWNQAPFYAGRLLTDNFVLDDDTYRKLILGKAMVNIMDCSVPALNALLQYMFCQPVFRGNAYVKDLSDMEMVYQFDFNPTPVDLAIILYSGLLPKLAGVGLSVYTITGHVP